MPESQPLSHSWDEQLCWKGEGDDWTMGSAGASAGAGEPT